MVMVAFEDVRDMLGDVLQLGERTERLEPDTPLAGSLPELDSMAVVAVLTAIEERWQVPLEDDEIGAETFATVGSLHDFIEAKVAR